MPPEQLLGEEVDARADLYAVGVVLFEAATGKLPFEAATAMTLDREAAEGRAADCEERERRRARCAE